ncbi:MAG: hypothetical protein Q8938_19515, partial [Bacteroidota bacterium]|nr:hypothetical protein [Bacteroidota bacterium]
MSLSTTLFPPKQRPPSLAAERATPVSISAVIPLYVYAVSLASLLIVAGILWDIAWHKSIGRDKFLSPPHILIYLGAIFAGLFSGIQVLRNSYRPNTETKGALVRVWGIFYSSLGALFCIWGAIAMLTSAPFDNWWHSAYGLDLAILTPPHTLLGLGMQCLQFGACVSICLHINILKARGAAERGQLRLLQFLFIVCASSLMVMLFTLGSAYLDPREMRTSICYQVATLIALLFLPAFSRALRMKWGMTSIALGYFVIQALSSWILRLFPAEPKLGPILTHITHFQPAHFPLLIVVPALAMDVLIQRSKAGEWTKSLWLALIFVGGLLVVQYPFSKFLLESPGSRNWFFG